MRMLIALICFSSTVMAEGLPTFPELTVNGKTFQEVKVVAVEASGIRFMHATGAGRALFQDLAPEVRERFKFDPGAAREHLKEMAEKEKMAQKEIAAGRQKQKDMEKVAVNEMVLADMAKVDVDRFTQRTTVSFKMGIPVTDEIQAQTYAVWEKDDYDTAHFFLIFSRTASDWKWLRSETAGLLVDGTAKLLDIRLNTRVFDGGKVYESFSFPLTAEEAKAMLNAKTLAFKIGIYEYDLPDVCVKPLGVPYAFWWTKKKKQEVLAPVTTDRE